MTFDTVALCLIYKCVSLINMYIIDITDGADMAFMNVVLCLLFIIISYTNRIENYKHSQAIMCIIT